MSLLSPQGFSHMVEDRAFSRHWSKVSGGGDDPLNAASKDWRLQRVKTWMANTECPNLTPCGARAVRGEK